MKYMVAMESNQCQVCGAFFIDKTSLEEHIDSEHTKDELYSCILCLKTTLVQLVGHSRLDTNKFNIVPSVTSPTEPGEDVEEQELLEGESNHTEMTAEAKLGNDGQVISHVPESEQNGGKMEHEDDGLFYMNDDSGAVKHEGFDNSENETHFSLTKTLNGRFFCNVCQKEFSSHYAQKRHMMSHYDNRPNKCDICGKAFIGKQNLQVHYRIHTGEKPYRCKFCHKRFTQYGTMYRHTQLHLKGRLGGTNIQSYASLKTDLTSDGVDQKQISKNGIHAVNNTRESSVSQFSKNTYSSVNRESYFQNSFDDNEDSNAAVIDLSMHEEKNHSLYEDNVSEVNSNSMVSEKDENVSEINQVGNIKTYNSSMSDEFTERNLVPSGEKNAEVTNIIKDGNSEFQEGLEGHGSQSHSIGLNHNINENLKSQNNDSLLLSTKQDVNIQVSSSTEQGTLELVHCDICNLTFENAEGLESHQNLHREGNLHMCLVCGKGFAMGCTLRQHMMIHSGQKPHVCDVCGKSFMEKQEYQSHYRIHSSEGPYECLYCEKRFTHYETLHNHLQTHKDKEIALRQGEVTHENQETLHRQEDLTRKHQGVSPRQVEITHKNQEMLQRQGEVIETINSSSNEDTSNIKLAKVTKFQSAGLIVKDIPYNTGNMLIKQEVISEDDGNENETDENFNGENIQMDSDDKYRMKMIDKMHTNQDRTENISRSQTSIISSIKQENLDVQPVTNYSALEPGHKFLSQFERNRHLFSNNTGNQLPGIASFTSNHGNSSFSGSSINPLVSFHLTCKFCLQVFSHAHDLKTHMQIHFANFNMPGQEDSSTVAESHKYEVKSEKSEKKKHSRDETESSNSKNGKPHQCTVCGKGYQAKYCLRRHMLVHFGEKPFKCQICGRGFIEKQHLTIHFRIHTGEKPYGCKVCGKKFTQYGTLHNHLNIHKRKGMLVGNITDLMDNSVSTNNVTMNGTHVNNSDFHVSLKEEAINSQSFSSDETLIISSQSSTVVPGVSDQKTKNDYDSRAVVRENDEGGKIDQKPLKNNNDFEREHAGVTQMADTEKDGENVLENQTNGVNPNPPTAEKSPYIYNCELCNESFHGKENWKTHMKFHRGDGIYRCETCGKHCGGERALKRHALIHTGIRPFKCDLCEKSFMEKQHLQIHRRIHTGEKPYSCNVCDKRFTQYGTLHKHKRIHTKERPYKCTICVKAFAERRQLQNHMSTHNDIY